MAALLARYITGSRSAWAVRIPAGNGVLRIEKTDNVESRRRCYPQCPLTFNAATPSVRMAAGSDHTAERRCNFWDLHTTH
jgi:hypothetical protein